jgi:hypothetical protein
VPVTDSRVEAIRTEHPRFHEFLSRFTGQFGNQIWPSVILFKADAPTSYYTAEALQGFRDLCAISVVPYARADRMLHERGSPLVFSNIFGFYPWMINKNFAEMHCINPAMMAFHLVEKFHGQSFPEQDHTSLMERALDQPLLKSLLDRWVIRFSVAQADWKDVALFRSLNMADQAGEVPAMAAASIYDVGRSIALWVSAHEILVHPGQRGKADFVAVSELLNSAPWHDAQFTDPTHPLTFRGTTKDVGFASWLYHHVYQLRNDFLHGNPIDPSKMTIGSRGHVIIDVAACLFRMALTASLDITFKDPNPGQSDTSDTAYMAYIVSDKRRFRGYQLKFEKALLMAKR